MLRVDEVPYLSEVKQAKIFKTEIVTELHVKYQNGWSYIARKYHKKLVPEEWEIQWITGQLKPGQEAFISYKLDNFCSQGTFYTDSNGLYMVPRQRLKKNARLEANFYPVTSSIFIQDWTCLSDEKKVQRELSILTDRSQAGSSLKDGEVRN